MERLWQAITGGHALAWAWSVYVGFMVAAWAFGFAEVTEAFGGLLDRLGLVAAPAGGGLP